jgi:hypothetical protein
MVPTERSFVTRSGEQGNFAPLGTKFPDQPPQNAMVKRFSGWVQAGEKPVDGVDSGEDTHVAELRAPRPSEDLARYVLDLPERLDETYGE